jgi:quinol-cytochrome oxidoreductase complex cytochrome b subunit
MEKHTQINGWQKLFTTTKPKKEERNRGILQVANNLVLHLHPAAVPMPALRFTYTWGLGGISALLALMLGLTGVLLMFRYDARVDYAYISIQEIETKIMFGSLLRGVHHWSANLLVITTFLHLIRVFVTASYKQGRSTNWIIGVVLFILALASNFTGYLLPWDQLAYWAITVSTNLMAYIPVIGVVLRNFFLGGPQVGQVALNNFYALHVVFIPAVMAMLMGYHFWKVRKNGGISQPIRKEHEKVERLSTIPHLIGKEMAAALVVITLVILFSMLKPAPLGPIANPFQSPNPAKAAWYFVGLQELLLHMHPLSALCLVAAAVVAILITPFVDKNEKDIGHYFRSEVGKRSALLGVVLGLNLVPLAVVLDQFWVDIPGWLPNLPVWITIGVLPFILTLVVFVLIYFGLRKSSILEHTKANHSEALLGVFAFAVVGIIVLTAIGLFFRGANMALVLPF